MTAAESPGPNLPDVALNAGEHVAFVGEFSRAVLAMLVLRAVLVAIAF